MTRFVVILPAEPTPLAVGDEFAADAWPPHITLVPAFSSDAEPDVISSKVAAALSSLPVPEVVFRPTEPFVERGNVDVNFVTSAQELISIHKSLLTSLQALGDLTLDNSQHHGDFFVPHAKAQKAAPVPVGVALRPERVLVAALPTPGGNTARRIVWDGGFGG